MDHFNRECADSIKNFRVTELEKSEFLKPLQLTFEINGKKKFWDFAKAHDSVSILIYNTTRNVVILVKQFRPAMYITQVPNLQAGLEVDPNKYPLAKGYSLELCAGIVDKNCSTEEIARAEVLEECGYDVPVESLRKLYSFRRVGAESGISHLFYVEVTDKQKKGEGGGLREEGEFIQVVEMYPKELKSYLDSIELLSPPGFAVALLWFFTHINPPL